MLSAQINLQNLKASRSFSRQLRSASCLFVVYLLLHNHLPAQSKPAPSKIYFEDATEREGGIQFRHQDGSCGKRYLVELVGAGLATFDANNDGWIDAFMLNGNALPGATLPMVPTDQLFLNRHDGKFAEVTAAAGLTERQYGLGVTAGDFNNDGFDDLFITNYGSDVLYQNNGDGTFSDVTAWAGVADGERFGAGAAFLDIDSDGDLDLFSANYVQFSYERHEKLAPTAYPFSPGPRDFPPDSDALFLNNGDGTFEDISERSGMTKVAGPSMGVVAGDFDYDGDEDIFVCCDGAPNLFYRNDGSGNFSEDALLVGVAYDLRGNANGSMGVDVGDLDGDGLEDLVVTDYADQLPMLFRCLGPGGIFEDSSRVSQIGSEVLPHVKWGVGLVDLDCDGDRDAYMCNGHLLENAKEIDPRTAYGVANCVMENLGNGVFRGVTASAGKALEQMASSRGAAFDDLDNDGDIDCLVLNCDSMAQHLVNTSKTTNHWIALELKGLQSNRSAVGCKVTLHAGGKAQVAQVRSGRGYQSHYGSRLHFGLGAAQQVDRIELVWLGGKTQVIENLPAGQVHTILENRGAEDLSK